MWQNTTCVAAISQHNKLDPKRADLAAWLFISFSSTICRIMGIPKARVLPVPVFARAMRSRPLIAGSRTALCKVSNQAAISVPIMNKYLKNQVQCSIPYRLPPTSTSLVFDGLVKLEQDM